MKENRTRPKPFFLILLVFIAGWSYGQDIDVRIRYYNQEVYYPGSDVQLKLSLTNLSEEVYRFRLAESRTFNFNFTVDTPSGRALLRSEAFLTGHYENKPMYYREVSLNSGEEFSVLVSLSDYVDLSSPGTYIVRGLFYPELIQNIDEVIATNVLNLIIHPRQPEISDQDILLAQEIENTIVLHPLPPDETVEYMLQARQRFQWERFFLYLDLEELMLENETLRRIYAGNSEAERIGMLREFREGIILGQSEFASSAFLNYPQTYSILQTSYTPNEALVTVEERFELEDYTEIKEYSYYLRRRSGIWRIYDYDVLNKGTE